MTPLIQQLKDKKKGCGCEFIDGKNVYNCGERWYTHHIKGDVYDCLPNYCPICQSNIAILEQAIAEIDDLCSKLFEKDLLLQKQRQEILEKIDLYLMVTKGNYECQKALEELKQQLNQPKTEQ
jgi:hypothetical protein